ncbi:MAG: SUMF1/EgtB/PvdO family nonheme iron enzyme [Alphaproteobacteria bacterium]|nr:SUMF1/EgtB/PvdO family nonheme iron enzyme [Alphaproteobacteria bacterium]
MTPQAALEDVLLDLYRPAELARWLSRRFGRAALNGLSSPHRTPANQWVHEAVDGLDRQGKLPEVIAAMALEHPHKADVLKRIAAALMDSGGLAVAAGLAVAEVREERPVVPDPPARGIVINNPGNVQIIEQGDGYILNAQAPAPPPPADPTDTLLHAIIDAHKRLWRFQRWVPAGRTLQEVMVTVEVSGWGPGQGPEGCPPLDERMLRGPLGEKTLDAVLAKPAWGIRWALLGHPGSGKTTLLRRLAVERAEAALTARAKGDAWTLPLYVSLASWSRSGQELVTHLAAEPGVPDTAPILERALSEGRALLLFDGLDEVAPAQVQRVAQRIATLAERWPSVPMIVTSRFQGYTPLPAPFTGPGEPPTAQPFGLLHLQPLSPEAQSELALNWLDPEPAEALLERVRGDLSLKEMVEVPLLLTMLCLCEGQRLQSPDPGARPGLRTEVYEEVLTLLLAGNPVAGAQKRVTLGDVALAREALEELALTLVHRGGVQWSRRALSRALKQDAERWAELKDEFGGVDGFLADVEAASGLLFPVDGPRQQFRFLHRSLLEYLAACALARRGEAWRALAAEVVQNRANLGRWAEVFSLLAGRLTREPAKGLLEALIGIDQGLGLRALATCDVVEGEDVVELLAQGRPEEWSGYSAAVEKRRDVILGLWELVGDQVRTVRLLERFIVGAPPVDLAFAWLALEGRTEPEAVALRQRERFFGLAGRPLVDVRIPWVPVPWGRFWMGSVPEERERHVSEQQLSAYDDESPSHPAMISAFRAAATPVTVGEYERFAPEHRTHREWNQPNMEQHPVVNVCWYEAMIYAVWADARLPTEAEWEYAARAGSTTAFFWGDDTEGLDAHTWHRDNSRGHTNAIGAEGHANRWGLSDMLGNVWEWTLDGLRRYTTQAVSDPVGPTGLTARGLRGGSFDDPSSSLRSASRSWLSPEYRLRRIGFRCARSGPD